MSNDEENQDSGMRPQRRNSTISTSTVESSGLNNSLALADPFSELSPGAVIPASNSLNHTSQNNVKIDGSSSIHVGNVINKYYLTQTVSALNEHVKLSGFSSDFLRTSTESLRTESDSLQSIASSKLFSYDETWAFAKRRKYWICGGCLVLIAAGGLFSWLGNSLSGDDGNLSTTGTSTFQQSTEQQTTESQLTTGGSTTSQLTTGGSTTEPTMSTIPITGSVPTSVPVTTQSSTPTIVTTPQSSSSSTSTSNPQPDFEFISREEWSAGALDSSIPKLSEPIERIIVAHTAGNSCHGSNSCKLLVKQMQNGSLGILDVPFNFFIGGDGLVIEGRGFKHEGEHTQSRYGSNYNSIGIGVAFIGTFDSTTPNGAQADALRRFLNFFSSSGDIATDYKLFFRDQLAKPKVVASGLVQVLETFPASYHKGL